MPAPLLRRITGNTSAANTLTAVGGAVPVNRAFVASKVVLVNNTGGTIKVSQALFGGAHFATGISLAPGELYTESGLVALGGDTVCQVQTDTAGTALLVSVFGEEVDN